MAKQHELKTRMVDDLCHAPGVKVGDQLPTLKRLCESYQASTLTVRQVLNSLVADGWIETHWGKGSFIKRVAAPANHRNGTEHLTIGYVAGNLRMPLGMDLLEGLEACAHRLNAEVLVANSHFSTDKEREHVRRLRDRGVAGVVVMPTYRCEAGDWLGEELRDFPLVVADLYRPAMNRSHVVFDNRTAGREITERLLAEGRRRIAFVKFSSRNPVASVDERCHGYQMALHYAGLAPSPEFAPVDHAASLGEERHMYAELDRLLALETPPDAIIFPYDKATAQGVAHLRKRGVRVPETILCAGFDNLQGPRPDPWLTTRPDFRQLGERAAELLIDSIRTGSRTPVEIVLPCPVWLPPAVQPINHVVERQEVLAPLGDAFAGVPDRMAKAL
ncbi:MAG: substrate-binding domain-containing protein [bacterium]